MEINVKFTPFELKALEQFLKDYVNRSNLSIYEGALPRHLFLAFMKILEARQIWDEAMSYTD